MFPRKALNEDDQKRHRTSFFPNMANVSGKFLGANGKVGDQTNEDPSKTRPNMARMAAKEPRMFRSGWMNLRSRFPRRERSPQTSVFACLRTISIHFPSPVPHSSSFQPSQGITSCASPLQMARTNTNFHQFQFPRLPHRLASFLSRSLARFYSSTRGAPGLQDPGRQVDHPWRRFVAASRRFPSRPPRPTRPRVPRRGGEGARAEAEPTKPRMKMRRRREKWRWRSHRSREKSRNGEGEEVFPIEMWTHVIWEYMGVYLNKETRNQGIIGVFFVFKGLEVSLF